MKGFRRGGKKTVRKCGPVKLAHVSHREEELMQKWCKQGKAMNEIQSLTDRSKDTIAKHTDHAQPRTEKSGQGSGLLKSLCVSA